MIQYFPAVRRKRHQAGQIFIVDRFDATNITIKDLKVMVVSAMNDPISFPEDTFTHFELMFFVSGRIGLLLDNSIEVGSAQGAAGHRRKNLDLTVGSHVLGGPLCIKLADNGNNSESVVKR